MPQRNGRGPAGEGPGTGRMQGKCGGGGGANGYGQGYGDGLGRGAGRGRGRCHDQTWGPHRVNETLEEKEKRLEIELERVRRLRAATNRPEQPS